MKLVQKLKSEWIILLPLVLFIYFAVFIPVGITNDTMQYVYMHIRRDPLYPLFLAILRVLTGENAGDRMMNAQMLTDMGGALHYLKAAVWVQNILAWMSVASFTVYFRERFKLNLPKTMAVCLIALLPHAITPIASASRLVMSSTIMSEALALPLFNYFAIFCLRVLDENKIKDCVWTLIFALLLSLVRGQFMVLIIVWLIVMLYVTLKKNIIAKATMKITCGRALLVLAVFIAAFGLRSVAVKTYNLCFNGYYMNTTFGGVSLLTDVLYAAEPDMRQFIDDEEARRFFDESMTLVEEQHLNCKYIETGLFNRARGVDLNHDLIKFKCIDECWRPIHDAQYPEFASDYELETAEQDRIAMIIVKAILPHCIGTWLYNYLAVSIWGFIRTVSIISPVFSIYALFVYLWIIVWTIVSIKQKKNIFLAQMALFVLLCVCANVFSTATVIMCLSRYMIYMMPFVYVTAFMYLLPVVEKITNTHN